MSKRTDFTSAVMLVSTRDEAVSPSIQDFISAFPQSATLHPHLELGGWVS